jgi:uncharacterized membrane protein YeaQ/YmgE (transglycosylase-associated protein family)
MAEQPTSPVGEVTYADVAVQDPLDAVTRQQRLYLLAVSMIGVAIVTTGLVPSKIATFGIELNKPDRSGLLFLLALVTIYFLVSFIIYSASDYAKREKALREADRREQWRLRYLEVAIRLETSEENVRRLYQAGELEAYAGHKIEEKQYRVDTLRILLESTPFDRQMVQQAIKSNPDENKFQLRTRLIATTRMFFEFFLPPIVGLYAIYELLFGAFVFPPIVAAIVTYGLIGLIAGVLAKLVMPGDDPGGLIVTVLLGIAGTFIGRFVAGLVGLSGISGVNLFSILTATLGSVMLLVIYRLLIKRRVV